MQSGTGFEFACLCMAVKFNVATCWHFELSKLSLLHISFNIHSSNGVSCPIKFFHSKPALGRALGDSWGVACATTEKTLVSSVYLCLLCREGFPRQTCKNHLRRKQGTGGANFTKNKNDQWSSAARVSVSKCINPWYMTHSVLPFTIRGPRQVCLNCAGLWLCEGTVQIPLAGRHWYFRV